MDYAPLVRRILAEPDCEFMRHGRGDHDVWRGPLRERPFTVPTKIKSRHTANGVLKDAGLPKAF